MRPFLLTASILALAVGLTPAGVLSAQPAPVIAAAQSGGLTLPAPKAGHARPLVVVVADRGGAETTDFVIPYGVLKDSGLAEVRSLSTAPGPVQLMMSLKITPDQTTAQFDASAPEGADIVIVPAQMKPKSPELAAWLQGQSAKGATIVSICEGSRVLANAGLLKARRATSHWSALNGLEKAYPETTWVRDRRYVQDGRIISTTGVAASIPVSLALIEAMGGTAQAQAAAERLGVAEWGTAHRTADFQVTTGDYAQGLGALAAVWSHETVEAPIAEGTDEVALALRADAWGRSLRTKVVTTRRGSVPVRSRHGLTILPDAEPVSGRFVIPTRAGGAATQLDATLADMTRRYGAHAARLARLGMEYDPPAAVRQASR